MNTYGMENLLDKEEKAVMVGILITFANLFVLGGHVIWLIEMPKRIGMFWTVIVLIIALCAMVILNLRAMKWIDQSTPNRNKEG